VINSNLGRISHRLQDTATYSFKHFIQNCCQTAADTWLLLTAYRKSLPPYPMILFSTLYDLPFTHNTAWFAYHSALLPSKVVQGRFIYIKFICRLKTSMRLPVSDQ